MKTNLKYEEYNMAWDDEQSPWGKNKRPSTPEEFIASLIKNLKEAFGGDGRGGQGGEGGGPDQPGRGRGKLPFFGELGKLASVLVVIAVLYGIYSCFYTIKPGEQGVVLRFGQYSHTASPGLNFKFPLIDTLYKVDVENVRKEEFGFRTKSPGQKTVYDKRGYEIESLMLTGDKNVIDVEWIVQYKVQDPINFIFKVRDVRQAVRDVSEMVVRRVVGNHDFDYVLSNREILEASTAKELQDILNSYETGLDILTIKFQDVNPPDPVKPAFNEVNEADQDMKRLVNEAEETYNRLIPKARGDAKKIFEEAHGYSVERVNLAKGETARFLAVMREYQAAKNVTRQRLYIETMQEILPALSEIYVIDKDQRFMLPFMNMSGKAPAVQAIK